MPPHSREIAAMRSSRRNRRVGEKSPNSGCRPECSMRLPSERARQEPSSRPTVPSPEGKRNFLVRGSTSAQKIGAGESRDSEELDGRPMAGTHVSGGPEAAYGLKRGPLWFIGEK